MPGKGVRDVPAEAFIKAYAAHLKSNDNVCFLISCVRILHQYRCQQQTLCLPLPDGFVPDAAD